MSSAWWVAKFGTGHCPNIGEFILAYLDQIFGVSHFYYIFIASVQDADASFQTYWPDTKTPVFGAHLWVSIDLARPDPIRARLGGAQASEL